MRYFVLGFLLLCIAVVSVAGFRGGKSRRPPIEIFPDMVRQARLRPQSQNNFFADRISSQLPVEGTIARGDRKYAEMQADAHSALPLGADYFERLGGEHEQVLDIIAAIRHERGQIFSANLPNTGQAPNLPPAAIVEGPAIADGAGLRPIAQPPLPAALAGTLATRYQWAETIVEAALEGSRAKFIQALVLDGYVGSLDQAAALADDLLAAQAAYVPWAQK
jgi:alpha-galactosidase/6-phospho-beta-glucosidase family protein